MRKKVGTVLTRLYQLRYLLEEKPSLSFTRFVITMFAKPFIFPKLILASSSQTPYHSFPHKCEKLIHSVARPPPQKAVQLSGDPIGSYELITIQLKKQIDGVPHLLSGLDVIRKETACAASLDS